METKHLYDRFYLILVAVLLWKYAFLIQGTACGREFWTLVVLFVFGYGIGLLLLLASLDASLAKRLQGLPVFSLATVSLLAYAYADAVARAKSPYTHTTDAHAFMDYAARLLLSGKNPYAESLFGAYSVHLVPAHLQTPLIDGGISDRLAYPSLSFLALVPFVKLGIDTRLVYLLAFVGCITVVYFWTPSRYRFIATLPFFVDETYAFFSVGGVTDSVWALLLCLVVVTWKRQVPSAIFFGLACGYKQHAWLLAPFVAVALFRESSMPCRGRVIARFFVIAFLAGIVPNLPFIVWGPKAWLLGVTESLIANMVPLGEGPAAALPLLAFAAPKALFVVVFWSVYLTLLAVCFFVPSRALIWIAPSVAFFFNYRSLSSYWYFNLFPFVLDLTRSFDDETFSRETRKLSLRAIFASVLAVLAIAVVVAIGYSRESRTMATLEIVGPLRTWEGRVHRLDLLVSNRGTIPISPRFWLQGFQFQPLPGLVDSGPPRVEPGGVGNYSISSIFPISEFSMDVGGTVSMTALGSDLRLAARVQEDRGWASPHAITNGEFRFWDVRYGLPTRWELKQEGSPGAFAEPLLGQPGVRLRLTKDPSVLARKRFDFCLALPGCFHGPRAGAQVDEHDFGMRQQTARLITSFAHHSGKLRIRARTPNKANIPPSSPVRYGIELAVEEGRVLFLLGGVSGAGWLPDGTRFVTLPGPRDAWSVYEIDLDRALEMITPFAYPKPTVFERFGLSVIPAIPMRLALFLSAELMEDIDAEFGTIEDGISGRELPKDLFAELLKHPGQVAAMRGEYETRLGNLTRGESLLSRARDVEAHPDIGLILAENLLRQADFEAADREFRRSAAQFPTEADVGLGWVKLGQKNYADACEFFSSARRRLDLAQHSDVSLEWRRGAHEILRLRATIGLGLAEASRSDCEASRRLLSELPDEERRRAEQLPELSRCLGR